MTIKLDAADLRGFLCPVCKLSLGNARRQATEAERAAIGEVVPQAGGITICPNCSAVLVFDGKSGTHLMTAAELTALPEDERAILSTLSTLMERAK